MGEVKKSFMKKGEHSLVEKGIGGRERERDGGGRKKGKERKR